MPVEIWKPVVGFETAYEVSDQGRVRSVERTLSDGRRWAPRIMKPVPNFGYLRVCLCEGNRKFYRRVHRLVLEAFVGPCPLGMQGAHNNGKRDDARLENLRWDTVSGNVADKIIHGTLLVGAQNGNSKLLQDQVREIREMRERGALLKEIAEAFGVTVQNICYIVNKKTWASAQK